MTRLALCLLLACNSSSSPPAQAPTPASPPASPPPASPPPTTPGEPAAAGKLGDPCGDGDACGAGQTCVRYYGIAGPRGPEFKSCEIPCKGKTACPDSHRCITIADGPGQVCRPVE